MVLKLYVGTKFHENGEKYRKSANLITPKFDTFKVYFQIPCTFHSHFIFHIIYLLYNLGHVSVHPITIFI